MKKLSSLLLALCMTVCLLSGCGTVDVDAIKDDVNENALVEGENEDEINEDEINEDEINEDEINEDETNEDETNEEKINEDGIYNVSEFSLTSEFEGTNNLDSFFTLLLKDYCEWMASDVDGNAYGVVNGRPFCVENMRMHGTHAFLGGDQVLTMADPALIIVGDYNEDNFDYALNSTTYWGYGCGNDLYVDSRLRQTFHDNAGKTVSYSYGCEVTCLKSNFGNIEYYEGTDAELQLIVDVEYTVECEGNKGVSNMTYAVTMVNNTEQPAQWLISGLYVAVDNRDGTYEVENYQMGYDRDGMIRQGDRIYVSDFDVTKKISSETTEQRINEAISEVTYADVQEALEAYNPGDIEGSYALFELNGSLIPYYSDGSAIYHYEDGEVVLIEKWENICPTWDQQYKWFRCEYDYPYISIQVRTDDMFKGYLVCKLDNKKISIIESPDGEEYWNSDRSGSLFGQKRGSDIGHSMQYHEAINEYMNRRTLTIENMDNIFEIYKYVIDSYELGDGRYKFELIYLDNDDIPELAVVSDYDSNKIYSIYDGRIVSVETSDTFYYSEYNGIISYGYGRMGAYSDTVLVLEDGKFEVVFYGEYVIYDDESKEYDIIIDGKRTEVIESEYYETLIGLCQQDKEISEWEYYDPVSEGLDYYEYYYYYILDGLNKISQYDDSPASLEEAFEAAGLNF